MALSTVVSAFGPPPLSRVITTAGSQVVLCDATNTPIAANPQGVNHLPAKIHVNSTPAAGGSLIWLDANGTSNTLVTPAVTAGNTPMSFDLPNTAKSIEAGSTNGYVLIVAWHTAP